MKKGMLIPIIGSLVLTGCNSRKTITDTPEYQKTQQIATSGMNYVSEKTADFIKENEQVQGAITATQEGVKQLKGQAEDLANQAKDELNKQYNQLKEDAKTSVKDSVNQKIDQAFEKL
ncbi:MAG: hypothetical protein ACFN4U_01170 [Candidatus Absconditicoccaceae bacterium]